MLSVTLNSCSNNDSKTFEIDSNVFCGAPKPGIIALPPLSLTNFTSFNI